MSFNQVLEELSALTFEQRQVLIRRAIEIDDPALDADDEALVELRLAEHHESPDSAISLNDMKARLRSRFNS